MALGDAAAAALPDDGPSAGQVAYDRLMTLTLRHDFYGAGATCPDFAITPTAATETLLRNLRLIAKPRRAGIDIFYHTGNAAALLRYFSDRREIRHHRASDADRPHTQHGSWSRLTLTFSSRNALFTNFTDTPAALRPGGHTLYLSNRSAGASDGAIVLAVDWTQAVAMPKVNFSPAYVRIPTTEDATDVRVYDTSGRVILHAVDPTAAQQEKQEQQIPRTIDFAPGKDVDFDMSEEPAGLYSYRVTPGTGSGRTTFLHAGLPHAPLIMADLFFASPYEPAIDPGLFPIALPPQLPQELHNIGARQHFTRRDYEIRFKARETIWTYYIVRSSGEPLPNDLEIRAEPSERLEFIKDPKPVPLPTGALACRFTATTAKPLQRRSEVALRLHGGGAGNGSARILLERLPTPSAERIGASAASDVFVYL